MYIQNYEDNYKLMWDGLECKNDKPISCYSGAASGAVIMGWTVARFLEESVEGTKVAISMLDKLQEAAGPIHALNYAPAGLNNAIVLCKLWNSRVLLPGRELPENTVWQVKEQCLFGPEVYDEIMKVGYNKFVDTEVMPRITDLEYYNASMAECAPHIPEILEEYKMRGLPTMRANFRSVTVPFEQLCGMRSMSKFYMDCYKRLDKLKEVSDFIFEENYNAIEKQLTALESNRYEIGTWVGGWRTASAMINPKIWETLVWPYMKKSAEQLIRHGKVAIMHLDQNWDRDIERFSELPEGKFALNTDSMTNIREARKKLPKAAFMGDVPATLLTTGTPEQVKDYVTRLIDDVGPQGLFIAPGCDCPVGAKFENLVAMVQATNEWH